jgi:hypothetical protein
VESKALTGRASANEFGGIALLALKSTNEQGRTRSTTVWLMFVSLNSSAILASYP